MSSAAAAHAVAEGCRVAHVERIGSYFVLVFVAGLLQQATSAEWCLWPQLCCNPSLLQDLRSAKRAAKHFKSRSVTSSAESALLHLWCPVSLAESTAEMCLLQRALLSCVSCREHS
jgi:hypothetical protein